MAGGSANLCWFLKVLEVPHVGGNRLCRRCCPWPASLQPSPSWSAVMVGIVRCYVSFWWFYRHMSELAQVLPFNFFPFSIMYHLSPNAKSTLTIFYWEPVSVSQVCVVLTKAVVVLWLGRGKTNVMQVWDWARVLAFGCGRHLTSSRCLENTLAGAVGQMCDEGSWSSAYSLRGHVEMPCGNGMKLDVLPKYTLMLIKCTHIALP